MTRKSKEYYENLDKRSKEYRDYIKSKKHNDNQKDKRLGLGDYAEKIFKYTGVRAVVKFLAGEDCGCDVRRDRLNEIGGAIGKWFRDTDVKCLTLEEYKWLDEYFNNKTGNVIHAQTQSQLVKIFNRVFSQRRQMSTCSPCVKELVDKLEALYLNYENESEKTYNETRDFPFE